MGVGVGYRQVCVKKIWQRNVCGRCDRCGRRGEGMIARCKKTQPLWAAVLYMKTLWKTLQKLPVQYKLTMHHAARECNDRFFSY